MQDSPQHSAPKPITVDTIASHAACLQDDKAVADLLEMHAELCATRRIEMEDQKLRSFVVKHSVYRMHVVVVFGLITLAKIADREVLAAVVTVVGLVTAASTRSIGSAVRHGSTHS